MLKEAEDEMQIDLRSDTVTRPNQAMRQAMANAAVGDDVYGEDPTVNELEARAAALLGKEAALFVPTGTQGNQIAIMTHTQRGEEVVVEAESHVFYYEVAGIAALSNCQVRTVPGVRGAMDPAAVKAVIRDASNVHFPRTSLVCVEQTHNRAGGAVVPQANIEAVAAVAHAAGAQVHMDGARLFNAAVAMGRPVAELVAPVDSVMFCLSKGLGAPVGSILAGSKEFIGRARKNRKLLGGGMRQAGILAAAGLLALEQNVERLAEDHANARALAEGLAALPGVAVDAAAVETNMVYFDLLDPKWDGAAFAGALGRAGVLANATGPRSMRLVTHLDFTTEMVPVALAAIASVLKAGPDQGAGGVVYG
jgi:threonine aldolase